MDGLLQATMVDNHRTTDQLSRNAMIVMTRSGPSQTPVFKEERPHYDYDPTWIF